MIRLIFALTLFSLLGLPVLALDEWIPVAKEMMQSGSPDRKGVPLHRSEDERDPGAGEG